MNCNSLKKVVKEVVKVIISVVRLAFSIETYTCFVSYPPVSTGSIIAACRVNISGVLTISPGSGTGVYN